VGNLSAGEDGLRESFLRGINAPPEKVVYFVQTHSKTVALVEPGARLPIHADGGIAGDPAAILAITVADCLPIVLYDMVEGCFALVHSGWKGTGIAAAALGKMRRYFGTRPENVHAVIGPGISSCCYDVPEERARDFDKLGDLVVIRRNGAVFLDLKEANKALLNRAGVREIRISELCTYCSQNLGSYRREGPYNFTRMLAVVGHF
jgi:hypothetical protein